MSIVTFTVPAYQLTCLLGYAARGGAGDDTRGAITSNTLDAVPPGIRRGFSRGESDRPIWAVFGPTTCSTCPMYSWDDYLTRRAGPRRSRYSSRGSHCQCLGAVSGPRGRVLRQH